MSNELINSTAKMAKEAAELADELLQANADLAQKLATSEDKLQEMNKQAADGAETVVVSLSDDGIERAVDHIIRAGQAKEASRDELLKSIAATPDTLIDYVEKLASAAIPQPVKRLGKVANEAPEAPVLASEAHWDKNVIRRS